MAGDNIISTLQIEVYNSNNVRVGFLKKDPIMNYKRARYDVDYIDGADLGPPVVPATKNINLIDNTIEYFAMYTSGDVKVSINNSADLIAVNGQFVIAGTEITSVQVLNFSEDEIKLDIVQGDKLIIV